MVVSAAPQIVGGQLGRYELHGAIARGGMATVYVARMTGAAGFTRTVAVKRLHPHLAADPTFAGMFVDEARLAARIRHPNVVDTLDVVADGGELFLVMAFVLGETLSRMVRSATAMSLRLPPAVVSNIVISALEGLHAAHEATNERGEPLGIVHRDVSPQNILIARDGIVRVIDFGVAKAAGRMQETEGGELKGKLAYMAPEQLTRIGVDRRCDVFAMGVVLWEALTSRRLFAGDDAASTLYSVLNDPIAAPSTIASDLSPGLDSVVLRALHRDPAQRYATARDMAVALEAACPPASARQTAEWVEKLAHEALAIRADIVRAVEHATSADPISVYPPHAPDDLLSHPSGSGSGSQRVVSGARIAVGDGWNQGSSVHSSVSGVSGLTGTSGVTASGYADMTRVGAPWLSPPVEQEKRLPTGVVIGICTVLALMLAVGLVTGIKALTYKRQAAEVTAVAPPPPVAPAVTPTTTGEAPPVPTAPVAAPAAVVSATPSAEPVPTAPPAVAAEPAPKVATATPHVTAPPARWPVTPPAPVAKPVKSAAPPANDCENPFTIDANGVKRPKPQCFGR